MVIYFLRHASAGQRKFKGVRDERRPLDEEGIDQCRFVGRVLSTLDVHIDAILSSPLKRATQTASLVANELGHEEKIELSPALRPDASYQAFCDLLDENAGREAILVVGHNPSLREFLNLMISDGASDSAVELKKGAVARVETGRRNSAVLNWSLVPRVVRAVYDSASPQPEVRQAAPRRSSRTLPK
jgi:phosphohistidine phosphatase